MASALSCCLWPPSALVFPTTRAWRCQELMQCTRLVGRGLIKCRWSADRSFRLQVCMICRYTAYEITAPFPGIIPLTLSLDSYPPSSCKVPRLHNRAGLLSGSGFDSYRMLVLIGERSTGQTSPRRTNSGNERSGTAGFQVHAPWPSN